MESVPRASVLVTHVAVRDNELVAAEHPVMIVPLEAKDTVPVGVGGPAGESVVVKVTDSPGVDGLSELASKVVVSVKVVASSKTAPQPSCRFADVHSSWTTPPSSLVP